MEVKARVSFKEICQTLKQMPRTVQLVFKLEKKLFTKIILIRLITGFSPIVSLYISQELINSLVKVQTELRSVIIMFATFMGVSLLTEIVSQLSSYYEGRFQFLMNYKLNYMVMEKSSELSLADFENSDIYNKLERISGEIAFRPYQIFQAVITLITSFITLISSVAFLMAWNPGVSVLLLIIPVISLMYYLRIGQQEFFIQWKRAGAERKAWYLSYILTHDFSFKEIKLYNLKDYLLESYWNIRKKFIDQDTYILKKKTMFNFLFEIIVQLVGVVVVFVAIMSAYVGQIMVGHVISYIRSVSLVQSNSQTMMGNIYSIYNSSLYMNQLFEFLEYENDSSDMLDVGDEDIQQIRSIELKDVTFSYPHHAVEALKSVNLSLLSGERVAIVGPNGSGKSTLIKLLTALYPVQEGEILVNGKPIHQLDQESYRDQIAVLFQDYMKYEMKLQENVGFGQVVNMDRRDKIASALDIVHANFIKGEESYDLDAQLGLWFDEGRQLSGGQWQKIALARAYFRNASLYILDEPNAALDPIAEKETFDTFFNLSKDKIGIFISHRLVAARLADRIIVMDQGEVVGEGIHDDLINNCPVYKQMNESENYQNTHRSEVRWEEAL
ncbi:ABC transporter ATP-binding protein [Paenibacillus sp. 23TSA30-6]|uniref:ABC transporter ATP-binding protein n=1 Tax=Paenibacillus sp. 23TSA30-6 TaxID=2546104 RepID=UPI0017878D57|nr:ABC transporter ATP-binding protein [Paenibacillus sp. 23TSA30-6]MBE0336517.1 ABC transporter ATP-binding protein [Paenibacillus sp. 23TSA30-6]